MTKSPTYQSAQIGVIAVLLTTVLLAIGISISTRVVEQTQQELSRQESAQQFQQAESGADMGNQMTDPGGGTSPIDGTAVTNMVDPSNTNIDLMQQTDRQNTFSSDIDTVYLMQGDTVEIDVTGNNSGQINASGALAWELIEGSNTDQYYTSHPSLLITLFQGSTTSIFPIRPTRAGGRTLTDMNRTFDSYVDSTVCSGELATKYHNCLTISSLNGSLVDTHRIRIEALYAPTYVYLPGLTSTTRSVSSNQVGNESRVVEQNTTDLAPSYVTDFTIFAGNSRICQGEYSIDLTTGVNSPNCN